MTRQQRKKLAREQEQERRKLERRLTAVKNTRLIAGVCSACGADFVSEVELTPQEMIANDLVVTCECGHRAEFVMAPRERRWANTISEAFQKIPNKIRVTK